MDIPLFSAPVAKNPVVLSAPAPGDVVVPADGLLPPVVFDPLGAVYQFQRALPVQVVTALVQDLGLGHQPEGALQAGSAGIVLRPVAADMQGVLRQVLVATADLFYRLQAETGGTWQSLVTALKGHGYTYLPVSKICGVTRRSQTKNPARANRGGAGYSSR